MNFGREIATVLGGIGLLIFAYLLLNNGQNAAGILSSISQLVTNTITVLQGGGGNALSQQQVPGFGRVQ